MTTQPLLKESAATLKALCASCGLPKTGAKRVLLDRLRHAARHFHPIPSTARILSIDLGLKNFAFSLLTPVKPPKHPAAASNNSPITFPVHLHAWQRLDLTLPSGSQPANITTTSKKPTKPSKSSLTTPPPPPPPSPPEDATQRTTDPFSPTALSQLTLNLIRTHLLPLRPTHVLIERQRFRTGGAAAIFEWTLRVNTLEAMLHAAFAALNHHHGGGGAGNGIGTVSRTAYKMLKKEKVELLGRFLKEDVPMVVVPEKGEANEMVRLFLGGLEEKEKKGGRGGRRKAEGKKEVDELMTKMDDLSDAVLQGMVWLQWQRNLETLIQERPELLDGE
ncbi:hypothetical protein NEMBOFW57_010051 [Staphylotrichum longicolle]|uniref:SAP domain-containing protein n=1 Tax=Staphylotrichum longicolle TaxID=669026 RepID=A0AAD4HTQ8_9PEZI|nr:hypothetical protein NEMBOFW57_010051 [Staphylotrichum longicolle]